METEQIILQSLKRMVALADSIDDVLFHHNHAVVGWHLNDAHEPMMNFVAEMDMEAVSEAKEIISKYEGDIF